MTKFLAWMVGGGGGMMVMDATGHVVIYDPLLVPLNCFILMLRTPA